MACVPSADALPGPRPGSTVDAAHPEDASPVSSDGASAASEVDGGHATLPLTDASATDAQVDTGAAEAAMPFDCPEDTCCIGGEEYFFHGKNRDNLCEWCDPALSTRAFSPATGTICGAGCACENGKRAEGTCSDGSDNDGDDKLDCDDSDCQGRTCQGQKVQNVLPTKDVQITVNGSTSTSTEGGTTIALSNMLSTSSFARLEFDSIPRDASLDIIEAKLELYVEENCTVTLRGPAQEAIDSDDGTGTRYFDITKIVAAWADGSSSQRFVTLQVATGQTCTSATLHASEHADGDPHIYLTYEARCSAGRCAMP